MYRNAMLHTLGVLLGAARLADALSLGAARLADASSFPDCDPVSDAHAPYNGTLGPFGASTRFNAVWEKKPLVVIRPKLPPPVATGYPLVVFMHGLTGAIEQWDQILEVYASHGAVIVFPYIVSPEVDKKWYTTNTDGTYILHGLAYAADAARSGSPLHGWVDLQRAVVMGHSMGASCAIQAGKRLASGANPNVTVRLVVAQHPGLCGPLGPPPWPAAWSKADLHAVADAYPLLVTTATNDGAFLPPPATAARELSCFNGANLWNLTNGHGAGFAQFSAAACAEDGMHPPWKDGGHDCSFKTYPEAPWVLTALKLYAQQDGRNESACSSMLWGQGNGSLAQDPAVDHHVVLRPALPVSE